MTYLSQEMIPLHITTPYLRIFLLRRRKEKHGLRDKGGRICMIYLNVSPFKCNSPQTDKRSSTIQPPAHSSQKLLRREGMKRGVGVKPRETERQKKVA